MPHCAEKLYKAHKSSTGSPTLALGKHPAQAKPFVNALQCLIGKVDNDASTYQLRPSGIQIPFHTRKPAKAISPNTLPAINIFGNHWA